jgi:hypothetical protein
MASRVVSGSLRQVPGAAAAVNRRQCKRLNKSVIAAAAVLDRHEPPLVMGLLLGLLLCGVLL